MYGLPLCSDWNKASVNGYFKDISENLIDWLLNDTKKKKKINLVRHDNGIMII